MILPEIPIGEVFQPLFFMLPLVGLALSGKQKQLGLLNPSYRRCQWNMDSSPHCGPLEFAHLDHSRETVLDATGKYLKYDDFRRTRRFCLFHHLRHHQLVSASELGLTEDQNEWSIGQLETRLHAYLYETGQVLRK